MADYHLYFLQGGLLVGSEDIEAGDDNAAARIAEDKGRGDIVEVWNSDSRVRIVRTGGGAALKRRGLDEPRRWGRLLALVRSWWSAAGMERNQSGLVRRRWSWRLARYIRWSAAPSNPSGVKRPCSHAGSHVPAARSAERTLRPAAEPRRSPSSSTRCASSGFLPLADPRPRRRRRSSSRATVGGCTPGSARLRSHAVAIDEK